MKIQEALMLAARALQSQGIRYKEAVRLFRRQMIYTAIDANPDNLKAAAMDLGITPQQIHAVIREHGNRLVEQIRG